MRHNSCNTIKEPVPRVALDRTYSFYRSTSRKCALIPNFHTLGVGTRDRQRLHGSRCSVDDEHQLLFWLQIFAGGVQISARNAYFDVPKARGWPDYVHKQRPILRNNFRLYPRPWQAAQITNSKGKIQYLWIQYLEQGQTVTRVHVDQLVDLFVPWNVEIKETRIGVTVSALFITRIYNWWGFLWYARLISCKNRRYFCM